MKIGLGTPQLPAEKMDRYKTISQDNTTSQGLVKQQGIYNNKEARNKDGSGETSDNGEKIRRDERKILCPTIGLGIPVVSLGQLFLSKLIILSKTENGEHS